MNIDPKDPRLTAYALGELESEDERIEIEKALDGSEELTQIVTQIRQTAELMTEELQKEPSPVWRQGISRGLRANSTGLEASSPYMWVNGLSVERWLRLPV